MEQLLADPPQSGTAEEIAAALRGAPEPLHGGPLALLRFMRANHMLDRRYLRLIVRFVLLKLRYRRRLQTDGLCFICPRVQLEIGRGATLRVGRWAWIGHGCKIRVHEGEVQIGAKTVMGQECTISAFQNVSIGRECILADRVMLIDFDHGVTEVERPIRLQGIYKRDVHVTTTCGSATAPACCAASPSATTASSAPTPCSRATCPRTPSSAAFPRASSACARRRARCAGSDASGADSGVCRRGASACAEASP